VSVWLRDPQSIKPDAKMPKLPLQDAEIEALIAFLSAGEKQVAAIK
jgi:cytochrome c1